MNEALVRLPQLHSEAICLVIYDSDIFPTGHGTGYPKANRLGTQPSGCPNGQLPGVCWPATPASTGSGWTAV